MSAIADRRVHLHDATPVLIRNATRADAAALVAFHAASYQDGEGVIGLPEEASWPIASCEQWIDHRRTRDRCLAIVATTEDEAPDNTDATDATDATDPPILALLGFEAGPQHRLRHQGEFGLWVHPTWRNRGLGRHMLTTLIDWAHTTGDLERIGLTVVSTATRAIHLYKTLGFEEEGRRIRQIKYGPGEYADQLQMALFLTKQRDAPADRRR